MILTQCAAAPPTLVYLWARNAAGAHTLLWARMPGAALEGGRHDKLCKQCSKKAGGAEQLDANTKYTEAVAVAVEEVRGGTNGQTSPRRICTQALALENEGNASRARARAAGPAGFARVSCLRGAGEAFPARCRANNFGHRQHP